MHRSSPTISPESHNQRLRLGAFEINLADGVLRSKRRVLRLQEQPLQVLSALLESPGQVVTREQLRHRLWPEDTFVEFDGSLNHAVQKLREALGDLAEAPRYIETVPRRGYRLIAPVQCASEAVPRATQSLPAKRITRRTVAISAIGLALTAVALIAILHFRRPAIPLTERDEILIADVSNTTGETIFDDTLKTAVAVKIGESPFLSAVSDSRARHVLQLMQKPAGEKLVGAVAGEACKRLNVKALLNTSIARLGNHYAITLQSQDCRTGDTLAQQQAEAGSQGEVLKSLGQATSKLRTQLGETIKSVQRFDTPLYEATTPSLEALQAFSLGRELQRRGKFTEAMDFYLGAIEIDPRFALAYSGLGACTFNLGEVNRARVYFSKAFEFRERSSERERLVITGMFYSQVTGELKKAITTYQLQAQSYPREFGPHANLGSIYFLLGAPEKALAEARKILEAGDSAAGYDNLAEALIALNRYDEAAAALRQAVEKDLIAPDTFARLYTLAFVRGDRNEMQRCAARAKDTPAETALIFEEAKSKAFAGQLRQARPLYEEAASMAVARNRKQLGEIWLDQQALVEAELGNLAHARAIVAETGSRSAVAGLVLARSGDLAGAKSIADELAKRFPLGIAQEIHVPTIRAAIELQRGKAAKAVEALRPAQPYELRGFLIPYLKGYAHLRSGANREAAADFQNILDHRGVDATSPLYPLAYLGLGRAHAAAGNKVAARMAYRQFLAIWNNADRELPIFRQAKAEYAKL